MENKIKVVKSWDELPPVVNDQGIWYSTRVLERNYREMQRALEFMASQEDKAGNWAVESAKRTLREIGVKGI